MNWGHKIVFAFIGFAVIIITLVVISMRQDLNLVAEDYYQQEVAYQDQIDRLTNHQNLETKPFIEFDRSKQQLELRFDQSNVSGFVHFFRPANASLDKKIKISLDKEGKQEFDLTNFSKGLWRIKLSWKLDSKEFYLEKVIVI